MKTICRIARIELSCLFYSTIAWLVFVLFMLQAGFIFSGYIIGFTLDQQEGLEIDKLTNGIYLSSYSQLGLIPGILQALYLYIPLMAMGLLSKELASGSIKLLQSSPLTNFQIVAGKMLSMMVIGALMIAGLLLPVMVGIWSIPAMGVKEVLLGLAGLYLVICTYSAIGVFMSGLTVYQIIASIGTLGAIYSLNYIGYVGQRLPFIRDITYNLRMNGRVEQFTKGLISTKNLSYFIIVIVLFLGLSFIHLQNKKNSKGVLSRIAVYAIFVSVCIGLNLILSSPHVAAYADLTRDKHLTITKSTRDILAKLPEPLHIYTYVNILDDNYSHLGMPENINNDHAFFEPYLRFAPSTTIDYTYYYDSTLNDAIYKTRPGKTTREIAMEFADLFGLNFKSLLSPADIRKKIDPDREDYQFVRILESGGKKSTLRVFLDARLQPGETEINASLKRLIATPPKIAFTDNHYERSIDKSGEMEYRRLTNRPDFRPALINQGFNVIHFSLEAEAIPKEIAALVIADPKTNFSAAEQLRLRNYVDSGGNLMFMCQPANAKVMNSILEPLGISVIEEKLIQHNTDFPADFIAADLVDRRPALIAGLDDIIDANLHAFMYGAAGIKYSANNGFVVNPFMIVNKSAVYRDPFGGNNDSTLKVFVRKIPLDSFSRTIPVGVVATRHIMGKDQKIIVLGNADLFSDAEENRNNIAGIINTPLGLGLFKWISGIRDAEAMVSIPKDNKIIMTAYQAFWIKIIFVLFIPGFILLVGISVLEIRKRR